jgi:phosphomannomutase
LKKFIFDVDGTLTPSRQKITPDFISLFSEFVSQEDVYLVTGSDRDKTLEQITPEIYYECKRVYNCSGSDVYEGDINVYRDEWELPEKVERFLQDELDFSQFPIRNGNHIEKRPGGVNFSILGRDPDPFLGREEYIKWDKMNSERRFIAIRMMDMFPDLTVALGGQTGVDIGPKGADKSQILRDFTADDELHFFGDRMEPGGNDHSLGEAVKKMGGYTYNVDGWKETRSVIISYVAERDNTTQTRS